MSYDPKFSPDKPDQASGDLERNMRRTLGLDASGPGHRRRFARDGDVPVVVVRGRRDESRDATEARARTDQDARNQAERALATAQAMVRDLQTKLAHVEMGQSDLRQSLEQAAIENRSLQSSLANEAAARKELEARLESETSQRQALERQLRLQPEPMLRPARDINQQTAHSAPASPEPQPVDWWSRHERK